MRPKNALRKVAQVRPTLPLRQLPVQANRRCPKSLCLSPRATILSAAVLCACMLCVALISGCVKPPEPEPLPPEQQAQLQSAQQQSAPEQAGAITHGPASDPSGNFPIATGSRTTSDGAAGERWSAIKLASAHLPNPIRIHDKVISGGLPACEAAFAELSELGVRTIISVDGAKPDVAMAANYQMRYVHLPHGYDGISEQRVRELAKAVRQLEGPIYIHCHHGKHRSPAAAGVACVAAGLIPAAHSLAILQVAGTDPGYRGLFQAAERVQALEASLLDELEVEFREIIEVPPMAEAMVDLEHVVDRLRRVEAAGWSNPKDHPDVEPDQEALLLREHFTELLRTAEVKEYAEGFAGLLRDSEHAAESLHVSLVRRGAGTTAVNQRGQNRELQSADATEPDPQLKSIKDNWKTIVVGCKECHEAYRDVPLSERNIRK